MRTWTIKNFCLRALAVTLFLVVAVFLAISPFFSLQSALVVIDGVRAHSATYFIHSPTCFAREKNTLSLFDLPFVQGEKATYLIEEEQSGAFLQGVLSALSAHVLWTEEVGEVRSYYAVSDTLSKSVLVAGEKVNLHIAIGKNQVVIGTPIIFGGY